MRIKTEKLDFEKHHPYVFVASYNPTFPEKNIISNSWISERQFGLNPRPVILIIANYRSGLIWDIIKDALTLSKAYTE